MLPSKALGSSHIWYILLMRGHHLAAPFCQIIFLRKKLVPCIVAEQLQRMKSRSTSHNTYQMKETTIMTSTNLWQGVNVVKPTTSMHKARKRTDIYLSRATLRCRILTSVTSRRQWRLSPDLWAARLHTDHTRCRSSDWRAESGPCTFLLAYHASIQGWCNLCQLLNPHISTAYLHPHTLTFHISHNHTSHAYNESRVTSENHHDIKST